jgi:hypothetical protein
MSNIASSITSLASQLAANPALGTALSSIAANASTSSAAATTAKAYLATYMNALNATPPDMASATMAMMMLNASAAQLPSGVAPLLAELSSPTFQGSDISSKIAREQITEQINALLATASSGLSLSSLVSKLGL